MKVPEYFTNYIEWFIGDDFLLLTDKLICRNREVVFLHRQVLIFQY